MFVNSLHFSIFSPTKRVVKLFPDKPRRLVNNFISFSFLLVCLSPLIDLSFIIAMIFIIVVFHFILQIRAFIASLAFDVRKAILSGIIGRAKMRREGEEEKKVVGRFIAAMIDMDCDDPFMRCY